MLVNDKDITFIKTNKFKRISYVFKFINKYDLKKRLTRLIYSQLLDEFCDEYPDKLTITLMKDELYNPSINVEFNKIGNYDDFSIIYTFLNPKYSFIELKNYNEFIKKILFKNNFSEKNFNESKKNIIDKITRRLENPIAKAFDENTKYINNFLDFNIHISDLREELKKFTYKDFLFNYQNIFKCCKVEVLVLGDVIKDDVLKFIKSLNFQTSNLKFNFTKQNLIKLENKTSTIDNDQSVVIINFNSPYHKNHPDYYKWIMTLYFLAGSSSSLFFKEIREKNSLCYHLSIGEYKYDGIFYCYGLIDPKNCDKFINLTLNLIDNAINNDIDIENFERIKKNIIQEIKMEDDNLYAIIQREFENKLLKSNISISDLVSVFNNMKIEDIKDILRNVEFSYYYHLKGGN